MTRPTPKNPRRITIQEKFARDTGGTVTGKGKQSKEAREYIREYQAKKPSRLRRPSAPSNNTKHNPPEWPGNL